ncbi:ABC-three component system protein [Actinoplanes sp. M2I2]|uniref:ABC-three component system protein n=1 Tax=Actinoplanes sp. M2I2 TaxID=1734444 RepID=UPI00202126E6|nr:ABC-three component system protein [Actinoplanes sp. M2I2]
MPENGLGSAASRLSELPSPPEHNVTTVSNLAGGPAPTPKQRIHFYSPDEWEEFILEWATGLQENYTQIKRIGGSNDRGADVAAFLSDDGFEGAWDCMQCKHYEESLRPSDAYPEMFKLIRSVVEGHYTFPRRYYFLAPQGCGQSLKRMLSKPTELRTKFLEKFDGEKPLGVGLAPDLVEKIRAEAEVIDYSTFQSMEMHEVLEVHRRTPYYAHRFGGPLPPRPAVPIPPDAIRDDETRYIEHLLDVYVEHYVLDAKGIADVKAHPQAAKHFSRQREAFYSAEALRIFARDSVMPGTFEELQEEVYDGVIETAEQAHSNGMERLMKVLEAAALLALTSNALIHAYNPRDKRGICHQLANIDRLVWCDPQ